jgi:hypothetical protein
VQDDGVRDLAHVDAGTVRDVRARVGEVQDAVRLARRARVDLPGGRKDTVVELIDEVGDAVGRPEGTAVDLHALDLVVENRVEGAGG